MEHPGRPGFDETIDTRIHLGPLKILDTDCDSTRGCPPTGRSDRDPYTPRPPHPHRAPVSPPSSGPVLRFLRHSKGLGASDTDPRSGSHRTPRKDSPVLRHPLRLTHGPEGGRVSGPVDEPVTTTQGTHRTVVPDQDVPTR